jgi:hypothetical protein
LKLPTKYVNDPIDMCETIINDMPSRPGIEHGGDTPYYNWMEDRVKVPNRDNFILSDEYYATLFHELAHSTGHTSRLNRDTCMKPAVYGSRGVMYSGKDLRDVVSPIEKLKLNFKCSEIKRKYQQGRYLLNGYQQCR